MVPHFVLAPSDDILVSAHRKMGHKTKEGARHAAAARTASIAISGDAGRPGIAAALNRILAILLVRTKHDFRGYRKDLVLRRVRRRMRILRLRDLAKYERFLRDGPEEAAALSRDLLVLVTAFFREPKALHVLGRKVLPKLVERLPEGAPIRMWIPACATGEEAYTIGILLIEAFEAAERSSRFQIFATDTDPEALKVARRGVYPDGIANDVKRDRLQRFFVPFGRNEYRVSKQLRDGMVFARQDVFADAPFSRIHLVSCRNLLVHLEPELQARALRRFHSALSHEGYLLLAPTESSPQDKRLFEVVSKRGRVLRRIGRTRRDSVGISITGASHRPANTPATRFPREPWAQTPPRPRSQAVARLESELEGTRKDLQRAVEELEASNEEIRAMNEEQQSANEELETSKEALRSLNEELQSVNAELRSELEDAEVRNHDVTNLLASTEIATLVLDDRLRIQRYTPAAEKLLSLTAADVGRPIGDLSAMLANDHLADDVDEALGRPGSVERDIWSADPERGRCHLRRVVPRKTSENRVEGVVVTFVDVTPLRSTVAKLRDAQAQVGAELDATRRLQRLGSRFLHDDAPDSILDEIVDTAIAIVGSDFGSLQLLDPDSGGLRVVAQRAFANAWTEFWDKEGHGRGACGAALRDRCRVIVEDIEHSPIFAGRLELEVQRRAGVRSVQSTPLLSRAGKPIGVLSTYDREPGRPSDRALVRLDLLARQAADLLERSRTLEDLRLSEQKYRALFGSIDEGFCVIELLFDDADRPIDYRFLEVNPSFARLTGIQGGVGRTMREIAPDHEEHWFRIYGEIATTGASRRFEHEAKALGRYYDVFAFRVGEPEERQVAILFGDITERKKAQSEMEARVADRTRELSENRTRTKSIIDTVVDAIVTIDERGTIDLFNPAAERMFGYRAEEVLGRNVKMLMLEEFAAHHDGYLSAYLRTGVAKIIGIGREVVGRRKDGSTFPIDLAVAEIRGDSALRFVGTMRDLTAAKRSREALEREHALSNGIVSTAQVIILQLDDEGRILNFNRYMQELCGYSLGEVRGKDWFKTFVPERDQVGIQELFERAIRGQKTRGNVTSIRKKDGSEVLVEWYDATLEVPGEATSLICIGHDVTARVKLEKEYLQAQKMEAVGRLAAGVAHDVNNLLAGLSGGLRIISKEVPKGGSANEMLEEVRQEVERGAAITRRLLDFSRIGKRTPAWIQPREVVAGVERMIRRLIGEDVEVRVESAASSSRIFADPGQVEQALLNLAINSRDAMPRGGKLEILSRDVELSTIDVARMMCSLSPGPHIVLSVADTGCGMDEETLKRAIEPFFTTKGTGLGTGLGLPSVAATMEQCGGHLAIESALGAGTKVSLFFPCAKEAVVRPVPLEPRGSPTEGEVRERERILLVEDEPLVRVGIAHILRELGYVVSAVKDASAALATLEGSDRPFDLLLTDVVLPGLSGPELTKMAQKKCPELRSLLMSAFPAEELVAQGRITPDTLTLEKPFTDEQLVEKICLALASGSQAGTAS